MARTATKAERRPEGASAAILTPTVDLLLAGGLSLVVFVPLLLTGASDLVMVGAGTQAVIATAINMPHFMASYRIVYRSREMILRHKWASIYVPLIMLGYMAATIWEAQGSDHPLLATIFIAVSSAYLAWHYTGQVWGMMASYAAIAGTGFDKTERVLIRSGLRILLAWHVTWFLYTQLADPGPVQQVYWLVSAATVLAFVLGAVGILRMRRRTGALPPARSLVAWLALFCWYAVMARDRNALFWVQIAHALQYLAFPVRVEINHTVAEEKAAGTEAERLTPKLVLHMALYGAALLLVSWFAAQVLPGRAMDAVGALVGEQSGKVVPVLILMFINIHHYFTDGVIWKISNPEVRQELFAHVPSVAARKKR
jgi:hypothetical protein